jgi:hypothetical protein
MTLDDVLDILDFVPEHDLIGNVDPVQYTIRLLLPEGSLLLDHPELEAHLGPYDPELLTYTWTAADRKTDRLQARLAALVGQSVAAGEPIATIFSRVRAAAYEAAGRADGPARRPEPVLCGSVEARPRLTEPWFC